MNLTEITTAGRVSTGLSGMIRTTFGGRRGLLVLGAAALALGLTFKWDALVAAGVAPVLVAMLPCVGMCALGLCMNMKRRQPTTNALAARSQSPGLLPASVAPRLLSDPRLGSDSRTAVEGSIASVDEISKTCCDSTH